ncbi:hypothetical protein [Archangium violaceum]|uniref:hypothetical protein n=1 Tax=Archangium violaceum TaxID=83451 RepID=UPI001EF01F06|nr:hypothetical protein [Archangium violaceum]
MPGERLSRIPGPMPGFGPFQNYSDALLSACPLILEKPHATAGRPDDPNFDLYWRLSTEYCAWLYHTPDGNYELSMLAASAVQDDSKKRRCDLPAFVEDPRYPAEGLGYVFVLHNHPYTDTLTELDIRFIVDMGRIHGFEVQTKKQKVPLSIVAFFSNNKPPRCDGFYQYAPLTGQILKWTVDERGMWDRKSTATVIWTDSESYRIEKN